MTTQKTDVKHTPGPWTMDEENCNFVHEGAIIARYYTPDDFPCLEEGTPEMERAKVELAANAQLIAAAPDLLALAKQMLVLAEGNGRLTKDSILADAIRATIAKSTTREEQG